ncbi:H-2 class II histocompatibility antigen, A-U alpha chain-like [Mugil cephalus]|uniref:H-2 class II histocompatibility antigen, A-U alpha chain-like n=1 Tax=Mugil cephalus TaxID=48193 RepID=UPI001FB5EB55|nr:H-2 class II histocompatibility antigen, A-U alpha chain-like [Mugil cephalus]
MTLSVILLVISTGAVCTSATKPSHDFHFIYGCYESNDVRVDIVVDDDVAAYADFTKEEIEWAMPHTPDYLKHFQKKQALEIAKASIAHCHSVLGKAKKADPKTPLRQDAPDTFIYTRYKGEDGGVNALFCLANHFYPPTINFTWTKNGAEVTDGVLNLRYRHNGDGTFHRISMLSITPREGELYSCRVEHQALKHPLTRSWELEENKRISLHPAAVFFYASLILCLMGIGAGVFFYYKRPN